MCMLLDEEEYCNRKSGIYIFIFSGAKGGLGGSTGPFGKLHDDDEILLHFLGVLSALLGCSLVGLL